MRIIHLNDKLSPHLLERELPVSHKRKTNDSQSIRVIPQFGALMAFDRAAAHLSFRRAARDLALSPSAVSHHQGPGDSLWREPVRPQRPFGAADFERRTVPSICKIGLGPARWRQPRPVLTNAR